MIDRPYAAVRELLDNAIDSGATEITLNLRGGGIDSIQVRDDGHGMAADDLELCWLPHATSKIASLEDLENTATLGFRGEALSSLAACSRLDIITSRSGEAYRLRVDGGKLLDWGPHRSAPGTTVTVKDLFFNMPARRRFIKSPRAESTLCRRTFLEKAAAHPHITFRLSVDGVTKNFFPPASHADRVAAAWPRLAPPASWWETAIRGDGFNLIAVHARPEVSRRDRQYIQIYANRRRIDEYALVQAVQHAYDAWMPGGVFLMAFVFVEINPALVDFNIHPAKKEARFRDLPAVRQRLIEGIKDRITKESYGRRAGGEQTRPGQSLLIKPQSVPSPS
ncbi:MAG: DNA mismatch repair endonuclease MutL, partial [Desulfobacterales bacterium]|nr:DNA mismatch repair endonuclease MutL [Desulfobacterales bacterium]